mgnify:FL=1
MLFRSACDYLANQFFLLREPEGTANSTIIDRVEKLPELRSAEQTISSPQPNSLQDAVPVQQRSELQWVGLEHERGWLWIHLELIPPKDEPGTVLYLVHRIFLNQIDRQENSVQILFSRTQRSSLQFKRQSPVRLFDTSAPQ